MLITGVQEGYWLCVFILCPVTWLKGFLQPRNFLIESLVSLIERIISHFSICTAFIFFPCPIALRFLVLEQTGVEGVDHCVSFLILVRLLLISLGFKSILSDISIATPASFLLPFA